MPDINCFLCRKHVGQEPAPPGGYIYQDAYWLVCHAPSTRGPLGALFIGARRHILDFASFDDQEAVTFGPLTKRVYEALWGMTGPERIYQISIMEGIAHFHAWLVPRSPDTEERGVAFLARDLVCTDEAAARLAAALRTALQPA